MEISVAICTWNREELLKKTLSNLCDLFIPEGISWELLIVNNNSTDNTEKTIDSFKNDLPIESHFEPKPGLSNARNKAVDKAKGNYIIWTDDDVLVDSNWLASYVQAFQRYPQASVFGGPISPWFEGTPPKWLQNGWHYIQPSYAIRELGEEAFAFKSTIPSKFPFGANFAVRMDIQKQIRYNPDLGLKERKRILGEETDVIKSILTSGKTGWWVPDAKVKHWLPASRQTLSYIREYYEGAGRMEAVKENWVDCVKVFGYPRWLFRQLLYNTCLFIFAFLQLKKDWVVHYRDIWRIIGKLREYKCKVDSDK